jgi:hypothetical protein
MEFLDNTILITDVPDVTLKNKKEEPTFETVTANPTHEDLLCEAGEEALNYFGSFNLIQKPNFIILSSVRHYLYDAEELKRVKTLINLKAINEMRRAKFQIRSMNNVLPEKGHLAGCFIDYKREKERIRKNYPQVIGLILIMMNSFGNRILPRIPIVGLIYAFVYDGRIKFWKKEEVCTLLVKNGFNVINMHEINGLTYFISQKVNNTTNRNISLPGILNGFRIKF